MAGSRRVQKKRPGRAPKKGTLRGRDSEKDTAVKKASKPRPAELGRLYLFSHALLRKNNVKLSPHAEELLQLAARAWVSEKSDKDGRYSDVLNAPNVVKRILVGACEDSHVVTEMKEAGEVSFFGFFAALSHSGTRVFRQLLKKGF